MLRLFKRKNKDFTIGKATDKDISLCVDTMYSLMEGQPINRKVLEQTLKNPNTILLVAKTKGKIIGIIRGLVFPTMVPPPRIDFISGPEEVDGNQVISSLIDNFIEEVQRRLPNASYINTYVPTSSSQFVAMYSMKGFEIAGFIRMDQPLSDVAILKKYISKEKPAGYTV